MKVFPLLVCPYASIVQLKPSINRETRGLAVDVKRSYCVVGGGWTWSKEKTCFLAAEPAAKAAAGEPDPEVALEDDSIVIDVEEVALMTERWNREGIEAESWVVGGRIRRAIGLSAIYPLKDRVIATDQLGPRSPLLRTTTTKGPWLLF